MSDTQNEAKFPVREARELVKDLMPPNAFIYWSDFLFHITLAWGAFVFCFRSEPFSLGQWISFFVAVFAFFRSAIFVHELTHLRKGTFQAFRVVWNVLCGFPLMIPSFLYEGVHNDHHNIHLYGTDGDGEYFPFVKEGRQKIILFVLVSFVLPVFFFFRAVVLTPLSYCHKGVRSFVLERASSFSIDLSYKRALSSLKSVPMWQTQEAVACLYGWGYVWLIGQGILPYRVLGFWFCIFGVIFFVNSNISLPCFIIWIFNSFIGGKSAPMTSLQIGPPPGENFLGDISLVTQFSLFLDLFVCHILLVLHVHFYCYCDF